MQQSSELSIKHHYSLFCNPAHCPFAFPDRKNRTPLPILFGEGLLNRPVELKLVFHLLVSKPFGVLLKTRVTVPPFSTADAVGVIELIMGVEFCREGLEKISSSGGTTNRSWTEMMTWLMNEAPGDLAKNATKNDAKIAPNGV
ncbi:unnamed protein product [Fusarium graminearum]|uniref:Chromosome 4, complete genome n=1 Tax=Gibberella zeae (strain ATCC MYA-4620 / CBS 123657 / FGSC 9075 / NRRL 31084 / PH-1) TaxID=229533 RepID=I1S8B5_GIBZE|nr:hypothetical protein FGSG_13093 [Fusarium graminearum PH-1]ESU13435.1 hypothetical protein FGSG_13093 [Fusarium graminearum PH-1]CEF84848.1 unnamed protein product [Fusarium graminearum]CZS73040.1 unnamed protein product [Fusarium graminearum]|eukprot:XP_011326942.1 hypothetical protein FGSG_13093 [Fusarium graminearum PH-1]